MDRRSLKRNYNESLATSLLEILCSSHSSYSSCVLRVLSAFFLFEGLWWKFFSALEAWIHRALLICGLLRFLEAFELDSTDLWDLGRWFGWFLFECSCIRSRSSWSSWRLQGLIPVELLYFWILVSSKMCWSLGVLVCRNALGRLLFIGVWRWVSNTWRSLISDMCHSLIWGALRLFLQDTWHLLIGQNVLIFKVTHVNTRLNCLCHRLHAPSCLCHRLHPLMCD